MSEIKKKILVIDDEIELGMALKIRLTASGFEVKTITDGVEGIALIESFKPDIVLLDYIMPKADGLEICKRIKSQDKFKSIPVIMFTAAGDKDIESKINNAGAQGYINKPFDTQSLLNLLNKWI